MAISKYAYRAEAFRTHHPKYSYLWIYTLVCGHTQTETKGTKRFGGVRMCPECSKNKLVNIWNRLLEKKKIK